MDKTVNKTFVHKIILLLTKYNCQCKKNTFLAATKKNNKQYDLKCGEKKTVEYFLYFFFLSSLNVSTSKKKVYILPYSVAKKH